MRIRKLKSFQKICANCFRMIFMQEMFDGSWIAFEDNARLLRHQCILAGGYQ